MNWFSMGQLCSVTRKERRQELAEYVVETWRCKRSTKLRSRKIDHLQDGSKIRGYSTNNISKQTKKKEYRANREELNRWTKFGLQWVVSSNRTTANEMKRNKTIYV
jgi:hypothetical protein